MTICVHITAYCDARALACVLEHVVAQSLAPNLIRVVDNSPRPLDCPRPQIRSEHIHLPANVGTAGAINDTLQACRDANMDYLWLLDQDSRPEPYLLQNLLNTHAGLTTLGPSPVGIVAPLTRNVEDGTPNHPLRFDRYRHRLVSYESAPLECDFLPASGMLLHLPSLVKLKPPSARYFLDVYDFALGLAAKKSGASVWICPQLELPHQIGRKVTFVTCSGYHAFTDTPAFRVQLLHRNTTYLFSRTARGHYKLLAVAWQFRSAILHAASFLRYDFDHRWKKASGALTGWLWGLFCLRRLLGQKP
jgi:rhamnosyltransferase